MWGIPSLALDICSLCQIFEDKPKPMAATSSKRQQKQHNKLELDTDTIVIGNGPAGIALSALLSGWEPFYNKQNPHPELMLHERLLEMAAKGGSLLSHDLASLADLHNSLCELVNPSQTPFAGLYDSLVRPHAASSNDLISNYPKRPSSCLCWRRNTSGAVPHIVLGDQHIGGSWTEYDDDVVTVSVTEWMDLPGYSLATDFMDDPSLAQARPKAALYKNYLIAYVLMMGLERNFRPFTKVTQLEKFCHPTTGDQYWDVRGVCITALGQHDFVFRCTNVVLACGQQQPKMLGVSGELSSGRTVYSLGALKKRMEDEEAGEADALRAARAECPVVVVGDGISAADAVLHCLTAEQPVLHVIRRTERELRSIQLSRLSPDIYPEYARVFQLMSGRTREVNYRRVLGTSISAIAENTVLLETPQGIMRESFHTLAICIGRCSELPLLKEYIQKDCSYEFTTHYQSISDPTLFAVGAMAGDHFVRYLVGGSLCVAQTLIRNYCHNNIQQRLYQAVPATQPLRALMEEEGGLRKRSVGGNNGCTLLRTASAAGPLAAMLKAAALATSAAPKATKEGISRAKSQMQLTTAAVV